MKLLHFYGKAFIKELINFLLTKSENRATLTLYMQYKHVLTAQVSVLNKSLLTKYGTYNMVFSLKFQLIFKY